MDSPQRSYVLVCIYNIPTDDLIVVEKLKPAWQARKIESCWRLD